MPCTHLAVCKQCRKALLEKICSEPSTFERPGDSERVWEAFKNSESERTGKREDILRIWKECLAGGVERIESAVRFMKEMSFRRGLGRAAEIVKEFKV